MSEYIITDDKLRWLYNYDRGRIDDNGVPMVSHGLFAESIKNGTEIVRCRDCKKCNIGWCVHFNNIVKPSGFCSWGKRRDA